MGQRYMRQKVKTVCSFLIILILLPYVVAIFVNGTDMEVIGKNGGICAGKENSGGWQRKNYESAMGRILSGGSGKRNA